LQAEKGERSAELHCASLRKAKGTACLQVARWGAKETAGTLLGVLGIGRTEALRAKVHMEADELDLITSLIKAESSRDSLEIERAQKMLLSHNSSELKNGHYGGNESVDAHSTARSRKTASSARMSLKKKSDTPVSRLLRHQRQRYPVILDESTPVREAAIQLSSKRQSAALVTCVDENGCEKLTGILSEVDICRRLVGTRRNADETVVREIMTKDPCCVDPDEDFSVVLQMMVKHRFRHLPVVQESGDSYFSDDSENKSSRRNPAGICGLVDITQCLYDAIYKIERLQENQAEFFQAVHQAQLSTSGDLVTPEEAESLAQRTLSALMASISPPVGAVVQRKSLLKLRVDQTILDAALAMKEAGMTAVLVFDGLGAGNEPFVGILTCKDVMSRVVAKGLNPSETPMSKCMTGNPDTVRKDSSVLDALHIMQTEKYLHLPVVDDVAEDDENLVENGGPPVTPRPSSLCGVLSVLDCAVHTFASSKGNAARVLSGAPVRQAPVFYPTPFPASHGTSIPSESVHTPPMYTHQQWRDPDSISAFSEVRSLQQQTSGMLESVEASSADMDAEQAAVPTKRRMAATSNLVIKVKDTINGKVYRLSDKSLTCLEDLIRQLEKATGRDLRDFQLVYLDEDKDRVQLANDFALREARSLAAQQGWKKIDVFILSRNSKQPYAPASLNDPVLIVGGVCVVGLALLGIASMIFSSSQDAHHRSFHARSRHR